MMRRIVSFFVASMLLSVGSCVMAEDAAEYHNTDNSVSVAGDITEYSTVLITKGTGPFSGNMGDVVYIAHEPEMFSASMDFMLMQGAEDGEYRILFGNPMGETKTINFTLTGAVEPLPVEVPFVFLGKELSKDGLYSFAFAAENVQLGKYNALKITIKNINGDEKTGCYKLSDLLDTVIDSESSINLGMQVNNVPESGAVKSVLLCNITDNDE